MNDQKNGIGDSHQPGIAKETEVEVIPQPLVAIAKTKKTRYEIEMAHVVGTHQLFLRIRVDLTKDVQKDTPIEADAAPAPKKFDWFSLTAIVSILRMFSLILAFHQAFPLSDPIISWVFSWLAAAFIGGMIARLIPPKHKF